MSETDVGDIGREVDLAREPMSAAGGVACVVAAAVVGAAAIGLGIMATALALDVGFFFESWYLGLIGSSLVLGIGWLPLAAASWRFFRRVRRGDVWSRALASATVVGAVGVALLPVTTFLMFFFAYSPV